MAKDTKSKLEIVKRSLLSLGFSTEEAENQIIEVGKIVTMAIFQRLLKERTPADDLTPQNIEKYLRSNFNAIYLKQVIELESNKIVEEYLKVVTKDLPVSQKQDFYQQVQE